MEKFFSDDVQVKVSAATETVQLAMRLSQDVIVTKRMTLADWKRLESDVRQQLAEQRKAQ